MRFNERRNHRNEFRRQWLVERAVDRKIRGAFLGRFSQDVVHRFNQNELGIRLPRRQTLRILDPDLQIMRALHDESRNLDVSKLFGGIKRQPRHEIGLHAGAIELREFRRHARNRNAARQAL